MEGAGTLPGQSRDAEAQVSAGDDVDDHPRAACYRLLASVLTDPPSPELLAWLADLSGAPGSLGEALAALGAAARSAVLESVADEHFMLFIGMPEGEVLPYASCYLTGFLHDRPLADLRDDLAQLGIRQKAGVVEPEDHIGFLAEVMAGLITGAFGAPATLAAQRAFFQRHLQPWAERFFRDLAAAPSAQFYRPVAEFGRRFCAIEAEAFALIAAEADGSITNHAA